MENTMTKSKLLTRYLLIAGIILLVNFLAYRLFFRLDFTSDKKYTLSKATKDILGSLEEPLTIKAYFSEGLSPAIDEARNRFKESLVEYANRSGGLVKYELLNPNASEDMEKQAMESGVRPNPQPFREGDRVVTKNVYLGAEMLYKDKKETLPLILPEAPVEYLLSSTIKKISVTNKPKLGLVSGHGEASAAEMPQAAQQLSILYDVVPAQLSDTALVSKYKTLMIVAPKDSFSTADLAGLTAFAAAGKGIYMAIDHANADLSNASAQTLHTGLETWLAGYGIDLINGMVADARCGNVAVQQQMGFFMTTRQLPMPYIPMIQKFADHPVVKGIESVTLPFSSPMAFNAQTGGANTFTPLLFSSDKATTSALPLMIDIQKQWTNDDFNQSNLVMGGALEAKSAAGTPFRLVVYGDGDFAVNGSGQQQMNQPEDNINLMINAVDWLSDDTGLNELRTKGVTSRPLTKELSDSGKTAFKFGIFILPVILVLLYAFIRYNARRSQKMRWMQERYA